MSTVTIQPGRVQGRLVAPASKSSMQRACAAALLHAGVTYIKNPGKCNDDLAALDVIQTLGATIETLANGDLKIQGGTGLRQTTTLSCGESGLGIRMFAPIAALQSVPIIIEGNGSLLKRPMNFFDEIFPLLGIRIQSNGGKLPIQVQGPLQPKEITVDGSLSSQFLTGLLFAFAQAATESVTIEVIDLKSKPYIDLTLAVLQHFGYVVQHENYQRFHIQPHKVNHQPIDFTVEGDWSGASFLLVAGAIAGNLTITGLDVFSEQADKAILQALMQTGALLSITEKEIISARPQHQAALKPFQFDATDCPDLFPPLVALAACCEGTSVIEGVERLTHKESNRALTLQDTFGKMGIRIELQDNLMLVHGGTPINGAEVHSHHDHRIAMAAAVAALCANGAVKIEDADAINKSYPDFYQHLEAVHQAR